MSLLRSHMVTPFASDTVAFGLLPGPVAKDVSRLMATLRRLFAQNGSVDHPLLGGLPTHVVLPRTSPLTMEQLRDLFFLVVPQGIDAAGIDDASDKLLQFRTDPWGMASAGVKDVLERPLPGVGRGTPSESPNAAPPTRVQLERWWSLVTDPVHVEAEVAEMGNACDGATQFAQGFSASHPGRSD